MTTRNLAILLFDDAEVLDFCGPFEVFSVANNKCEQNALHVFTVAESKTITARNGLSVNPDHTLTTCPQPDILLVPGGIGSRRELGNAPLIAWIRSVADEAELVLSVCTGALLLGKAGLLDELHVTTHHVAFDELLKIVPSATVEKGRRFVDSGRVVTSAGIAAGIDMSLYVVERLLGTGIASKTALHMEYPWRSESSAFQSGVANAGVRELTGLDADAVSELAIRSKAHWGYTEEQMSVFRDELTITPDKIESRIAFGIEHDDQIVAFYSVIPGEDGLAELDDLFVDPDHLRCRLGTRLLRHAVAQCKKSGVNRLVLLSDPHATGFYELNDARFVEDIASSIPGRTIPKFEIDVSNAKLSASAQIIPMTTEHIVEVTALWEQAEGIMLTDSDNATDLARYFDDNPEMSFVAIQGEIVVGAVLCGHDKGRGFWSSDDWHEWPNIRMMSRKTTTP